MAAGPFGSTPITFMLVTEGPRGACPPLATSIPKSRYLILVFADGVWVAADVVFH